MSDDDNLTSCAHEKNVCGKVFCVQLFPACQIDIGYAIFSRNHRL